MLRVTLIIDNSIASPKSPEEFVRDEYLRMENLAPDLQDIRIEQGDHFEIDEEEDLSKFDSFGVYRI